MLGYIDGLRQFVDDCSSPVILRYEFSGICSESQMNRLINQACSEGWLMRVSRGVYVKARKSRVSGIPVPTVKGGFSQLVRLVLTKLNIEYAETEAWYEYQTGRSKHVPANSTLYVARGYSRKIVLGKMEANLIRISHKKLSEIKSSRIV